MPRNTLPFHGVWAPIVTPFRNGDIDYVAAADLVRYLVASGLHGLVVSGTTGEGPALSTAEKARLLDTVTEAADDHVPVFLGLEGANTAKMIAELNDLGTAPFDGCLLPPPSYVRPAPDGIFGHFAGIADAVKRPVMIYDIPARTGVDMAPPLIARLAGTGAFPAIKACGLSAERLRDLRDIPGLSIMCGDDAWTMEALKTGANGAVMASAQIFPRQMADIFHMFETGRTAEATRHFDDLLPLVRLMFAEPNPAPVKAALALQSWTKDELRMPLTPASARLRQKIGAELEALPHDLAAHLCPDKSNK